MRAGPWGSGRTAGNQAAGRNSVVTRLLQETQPQPPEDPTRTMLEWQPVCLSTAHGDACDLGSLLRRGAGRPHAAHWKAFYSSERLVDPQSQHPPPLPGLPSSTFSHQSSHDHHLSLSLPELGPLETPYQPQTTPSGSVGCKNIPRGSAQLFKGRGRGAVQGELNREDSGHLPHLTPVCEHERACQGVSDG